MNPKAVPKASLKRELLLTKKRPARLTNGLDPGGDECANVPTQVIEGEEVPLAVDIGQVVRVNDASLGLGARLAIGDFKLPPPCCRFCKAIEHLEIQDRFSPRSKGDRASYIVQVERNCIR